MIEQEVGGAEGFQQLRRVQRSTRLSALPRGLHAHERYRGVQLTPDGKRVFSGSYDGTVAVWDAASGERLRRLAGHDNGVRYVAVTPDGKYGLSASADRTLIVWRLPP